MKKCLACGGLVPQGLDACPNCKVERGSRLLKAAALVALVATGCRRCDEQVPVPVYGAPPPIPAAKAPQPEPLIPVVESPDGGSP